MRLREMGVRGVLICCADYRCSQSVAVNADRWPTLGAHPSSWLLRGRLCDLKPRRGAAHLEQSEPRQEREFWDRRPRVEIAAFLRTETGISLSGDENPRQRRAFLDSLCKMPKHRTGRSRAVCLEASTSSGCAMPRRHGRSSSSSRVCRSFKRDLCNRERPLVHIVLVTARRNV
jgi:hypothetical protein